MSTLVSTVPDIPAFEGGQMTDLPDFPNSSFDGTELFEVVWGSDGTAATALNYSITSALLASLLQGLLSLKVIINDGEHNAPGDPYIVDTSVTRVYVNKTVAEPTYIQFASVEDYFNDVIVADVAGTAAATPNLITITFNGSEKASGEATITIENPYGGWGFHPVFDSDASLAMWLLGSA